MTGILIRDHQHKYMINNTVTQHTSDFCYIKSLTYTVYIYIEKKNGDKTPPCRTPLLTLNVDDVTLPHLTHIFWLMYQ